MNNLFSTDFMPRGQCGSWDAGFVWLYVISNVLICAAYVAIFALLMLAYWQGRRSSAPVNITRQQAFSMRIIYGSFILFCGIGHLEGALAFFRPQYHLYAVWHALTAAVSWAAVFITARLRNRLIPGV
jgi:hypothetical protein